MAVPLLNGSLQFIAGEKKNLAVKIFDENNPSNDLSAATATVTVYNTAGGVTLAAGAATITGTTLLTVSRLWDTTSVTPGSYRAVVTLTFGSIVQIFQFAVLVLSLPAAQTM